MVEDCKTLSRTTVTSRMSNDSLLVTQSYPDIGLIAWRNRKKSIVSRRKSSEEDQFLYLVLSSWCQWFVENAPNVSRLTLLLLLQLSSHPECDKKWTIVTSGRFLLIDLRFLICVFFEASSKFARRALEQSGIPIPALGLVTANDVREGKPHPAPYLAGASLCAVDPKKCQS